MNLSSFSESSGCWESKIWVKTFIAGEAIDTIQTWKFMGGDRFYEANPLIGNRRGMYKV